MNIEHLYDHFHTLQAFVYFSPCAILEYMGLTAPAFNKDVLQNITEDLQFINVSLHLITRLRNLETISICQISANFAECLNITEVHVNDILW